MNEYVESFEKFYKKDSLKESNWLKSDITNKLNEEIMKNNIVYFKKGFSYYKNDNPYIAIKSQITDIRYHEPTRNPARGAELQFHAEVVGNFKLNALKNFNNTLKVLDFDIETTQDEILETLNSAWDENDKIKIILKPKYYSGGGNIPLYDHLMKDLQNRGGIEQWFVDRTGMSLPTVKVLMSNLHLLYYEDDLTDDVIEKFNKIKIAFSEYQDIFISILTNSKVIYSGKPWQSYVSKKFASLVELYINIMDDLRVGTDYSGDADWMQTYGARHTVRYDIIEEGKALAIRFIFRRSYSPSESFQEMMHNHPRILQVEKLINKSGVTKSVKWVDDNNVQKLMIYLKF